MDLAARKVARSGPFGAARLAAAGSLVVALGLVVTMIATVVASLGLVVPPTRPANLGAWAQASIPVRAPLPLSEVPGLWLLRGDIALHNARVRETPRPSAEGFDGPFAEALYSVERIVVTGARIWMNVGRAPRGTGMAPEAAAISHLIEPLQRLAFETLVLQGAHLTTQRVAGGQQRLEQLDALIQTTPGRGVTRATGSFRHRDDTVSFDAALQPVTTAAGRWSLPLRLQASGRHFQASFNGSVKFDSNGMRCDGTIEVTTGDLVAFSDWLGVALPGRVAAGPMALRGEATWRDGMLIFDQVQAELDGQVAQGALSLALGGSRPFLDGALAFKTLDVAPLARWFGMQAGERLRTANGGGGRTQMAGPGGVAASAAVPATGAGTTGSAPLPARLALFDGLDADLRLSVESVTGAALAAHRLAASLTARAGMIVADVADVEFDTGQGTGQLRIDQRGPNTHYLVRANLKSIDAAKLLAMTPEAGPPWLQGAATFRVEIAGQGRSFRELAATAQGELQLAMEDGGRLPIDLAALLTQARERRSFPFLALARKETPFDRLDARLALRQGTLLSEHLVVQKDGARVTADGSVLARGGRIYLRLLTDHGQGLARTARLGRSQSVLIHGDLANPTVLLEDATGAPVLLAPSAAPPVTPAKP